jgi:hypothetical protein
MTEAILYGPSQSFWNLECFPLSTCAESQSSTFSSTPKMVYLSFFSKYFLTGCCLFLRFSRAWFLCSSKASKSFILLEIFVVFNSSTCNANQKEVSSISTGIIASWPYKRWKGVWLVLDLVVVWSSQNAYVSSVYH